MEKERRFLNNKIALIKGAVRGIGRAASLAFAPYLVKRGKERIIVTAST